MPMRRMLQYLAIVGSLLTFPLTSMAALFDFEGEAATFAPTDPRPGALTSLSMTNSGLTITITRPGSAFDIVDNTPPQDGKPPLWAFRSLDPFFDDSGNPFVIDFSQPIVNFSVQFGDYGGDSFDTLVLDAYSGPGGTGTLLASSSTPFLGLTFPAFATGTVSTAGINSITMIAGTPSFTHSDFYDNFTATVVPEPSTYALMLGGLGVIAFVARRRKAPAR